MAVAAVKQATLPIVLDSTADGECPVLESVYRFFHLSLESGQDVGQLVFKISKHIIYCKSLIVSEFSVFDLNVKLK